MVASAPGLPWYIILARAHLVQGPPALWLRVGLLLPTYRLHVQRFSQCPQSTRKKPSFSTREHDEITLYFVGTVSS